MIISHRRRFIFIAVPKTATHAVREALRPALGDGDWEQQALYGDHRLPIPALAAKRHGHLSAREAAAHLPPQLWASYFKFAIVRNPYDRFVSTCAFLFRNEPDFAGQASAYMKRALGTPGFRRRVLVVPQVSLLTSADGAMAPDYIGRFESLQQSFDTICMRIGIKPVALRAKNASRHGHYAAYYDAELREMVGHFYRNDLQRFGYSFDAEPVTK